MDLVPLDEAGQLFLSPDITTDDWQTLERVGITAVFDLDGGLDIGVPTVPDGVVYLYFPFNDHHLPNLGRLHAVARFGAMLVKAGHKLLSHCGLGYNRSALVAGLILMYLGKSGTQAVEELRRRRPGALYNQTYASYLLSCRLEV
jgi:protein-tyrosine phosphatase